ncbi:globin domain-containing protein [Plantactinospora sp. GCM10030261]|uniref:globin domain-containing protein n=1 Tax=Plantactinospora sp. GCM10030261 TaxID=3273420 RepID=UPI00360C0030
MDNLARSLKESWSLVEDRRDLLAKQFYARLFVISPSLRQLFPVQMTDQRDRLLEAIVRAVQTIEDPVHFDDYLRGLGRDHRKYHVQPEHYDVVGRALLDALRALTEGQWNLEYDQAWREAYAVIAERMIAGAAEDSNPPFWHAEVITHERLGSEIAVLTCQPLQYPLPYLAGQYVSVEAPRHLPRVWRTYSVANAPTEDNLLEFHVRAKSSGWLSGALVRRVRAGDLLRVASPMGTMTLDPRSTRDVLCVAGGVGLAPIKALVEELARYNRTRWVHVFAVARTEADIYGLEPLYRLAARHPWLSVLPVCTDDPHYTGDRGTISDLLDRYGPWTGHDCFVSGSTATVGATLRVLAAQDVPAELIRYDVFGDT